MHSAVTKLLSISSGPIAGTSRGGISHENLSKWGTLGIELAELLDRKDGFYAYESALLVRPLRYSGVPVGVAEWNTRELWKSNYRDDLTDILFFAEDIFGGQFCIRDGAICTFDPETGSLDEMSSSISTWAYDLMADYEFRTGYPLAHAWQVKNSPLPAGMRLLPKTPFVCGGKYEVDNLYALEEVKGMQFRASIANQIRDLPDGAPVVLDIGTHRQG